MAKDSVSTDATDDVRAAFIGKTISDVDVWANLWTFHFSDGSSVDVDTEAKGAGIFGPVLRLEK